MDLGFDFQSLAIGGVALIPLVLGLVEFSKKLGVQGNWCVFESFVLAAVFGMLAYAIDAELIPLAAVPWISMVVVGLGCGVFGLAATGIFDLVKPALTGLAKGK